MRMGSTKKSRNDAMTMEEIIELAAKTAISVYDQQKKAQMKEKLL